MQAESQVPAKIAGQITVNGQAREWPQAGTLGDLLTALRLGSRGIAIEVNRVIVPRSAFPFQAIAAGDEIEIVTLVGGG